MGEKFKGEPSISESKKEFPTDKVKNIFGSLSKMIDFMDSDLWAMCSDDQFKIVDEAQAAFKSIEKIFNIPERLYFLKHNNKKWEHLINRIELPADKLAELEESLNKIVLLFDREWESSLPDQNMKYIQSARDGFKELNELLRK